MYSKVTSSGFNWMMAVNYLIETEIFFDTRNEFFFRKREAFERELGEYRYYWSMNWEAWENPGWASYRSKPAQFDDFESFLEREPVLARVLGYCDSFHKNKCSQEYVDAYLCCEYQSELEKVKAFDAHINSFKRLEKSEFKLWLLQSSSYINATEIFQSKKLMYVSPTCEWPDIDYPIRNGLPSIRLDLAVCKSLLMRNYPSEFGKEVALRTSMQDGETLPNDRVLAKVPPSVQKSARKLLDYLESQEIYAKDDFELIRSISDGKLLNRISRHYREQSLRQASYLESKVPRTRLNSLFVDDLLNQFRGSVFSKNSPTKRFPPEVIVQLCQLCNYNADARTVQIRAQELESSERIWKRSIVDAALARRRYTTYENLRGLFSSDFHEK
jgi:hypothetical protein